MEELRLVDSRHRLRVQQRLAVLAYAEDCGMKAAALYFGLCYRTVRRWRSRYRQGGVLGLVPRYSAERRRRVALDVRELIRKARTEQRFGCARTQVWLQRVHGIRLATSTIQLIFRQLGLRRLTRTPKRRPRQFKLFTKETPGESVQVDVQFVTVAHQRYYQYTALDDCTRYRVLRLYRHLNLRTSVAFLRTVRDELPFPIRQVQSNHGTEFSLPFRLSAEDWGMRHRYIRPRRPQQDGKVERSHTIDEEEFWSRNHFVSFDKAEQALGAWEHQYNTERFSLALKGRTPAEALAAKISTIPVGHLVQEQRTGTAPS